MQKFVALCAVFALFAVAFAVEPEEPIAILRSESNVEDDGSYKYLYEAANGIYREETGSVVNAGTDDASVSVSGSYKYIDADGQEVNVQYTADENGFVPVGNVIPAEISEAAREARNHPNEEVVPKRA